MPLDFNRIAAVDATTKALTPAVIAANQGTTAGTFAAGNDSRITGALPAAGLDAAAAALVPAGNNLGNAIAGTYAPHAELKATTTSTDLGRTACVSIVDDDGISSVMSRLHPILAGKGVRGSCSIITGSVGTAGFVTWANIDTLIAAGWEMLGHGHSYTANLNEFPVDADLDYQLGAGCQTLIAPHGRVRGFTFPQHQSDTRIRRHARKYYDFAFGKYGVNEYPVDALRLKRIAFGSWTTENPTVDGNSDKNTLNYYKACVDYAVTNGAWLVLMTHIGQQDAAADTMLGELLDYIAGLSVPVVTPSEGYARHGHRQWMGDGDGNWLAISEEGITGSVITPEWRLPINSKATASGIATYRVGITHMSCNGAFALSEGLPVSIAGDLITFNAGETATNYAYGRQEYRSGSGRVFVRASTSDTAWGAWASFSTLRWDQTAGRVAWSYDTINLREQLIYGDTGWRALTASLENGWTSTRVLIRRVGYQCFLRHAGLNGAAATATTFFTLSAGFAPSSNVMLPARNSTSGWGDIMTRANNTLTADLGAAFSTSEQHNTWITDAAWPASLPGTAAVSIPYN